MKEQEEWPHLAMEKFIQVGFRWPPLPEWTVLAAIIRHQISGNHSRVVALATGLKCLPHSSFAATPQQNQLIRDSHAEVLVRRGFIRYLIDQLARLKRGEPTIWEYEKPLDNRGSKDYPAEDKITQPNRKIRLRPGISFGLYISQAPCGEASMHHFVPYTQSNDNNDQRDIKEGNDGDIDNYKRDENEYIYDVDTAFLAKPLVKRRRFINLADQSIITGHSQCHQQGVLRTKPGRADALPSFSHSCSDKLALWSVVGWQGAILAGIIERPIKVTTFIIGEERYNPQALEVAITRRAIQAQQVLKEKDGKEGWINNFCPHDEEQIRFYPSKIEFPYSQQNVSKHLLSDSTIRPSNLAQVWWEETGKDVKSSGGGKGRTKESLVEGKRQGSRTIARNQPLPLSLQSSLSTEHLTLFWLNVIERKVEDIQIKVQLVKQEARHYQQTKEILFTTPQSPFYGWLRKDKINIP